MESQPQNPEFRIKPENFHITYKVFTRKFLENAHLTFFKHSRLLNSLLFNFGFFFVLKIPGFY